MTQARSTALLCLLAGVLPWLGCGSSGSPKPSASHPQALSITAQPQDQTVQVGGRATFTVGATGADLKYAWWRDGQPIPGATSFSYALPAAADADHGAQFSAVVTGSSGEVRSRQALLTVHMPPSITLPPQSLRVTEGQSATFSVAGVGRPSPTCQWFRDGAPIPSATQSTYTLPSVRIADHGAVFTATLTNGVGSITAGPATLEVTNAPIPKPFPENLRIRADHPRLFLDDARLKRMLGRASDIDAFLTHLTTRSYLMPLRDPSSVAALQARITSQWSLPDTGQGLYLDKTYLNQAALNYGLGAFLAKRTQASAATQALCHAYVEAFVDAVLAQDFTLTLPDARDDCPRHTLYALGVIYDWAWDVLTPAKKALIRARCIQLLKYTDQNRNWNYLKRPNFISGHSRGANVGALSALLAIRHDVEADDAATRATYFEYLGLVVTNWRNGYNPAQSWIGEGGGYVMGWAYGDAYTEPEPYIFWDSATMEERWTAPWVLDRWAFHLYGARNANLSEARARGGYDTFPVSGDVWNTAYFPHFQGIALLAAAGLAAQPQAAWLYQTLTPPGTVPEAWDLVLRDPAVTPQAPTGLPLARHFPNSGYVLIRDTWELDQATLVAFKSASFYSVNHHHRDQNAFTLFYRGPLAIDSGGYEAMGAYGSDHWYNYYTRTIAHNTLLVYDPSEVFTIYGKTSLSNDGGQWRMGVDLPTLSQIQPGGSNALRGICAFEHRPEYTYTLGDATQAYDPKKLALFRRSLVYLPGFAGPHPGVVIHDRVVSTQAGFKKTILLHTIQQPALNGQKAQVQIDDGMTRHPNGSVRVPLKGGLVQETLLPMDATQKVVGGVGFEFFVEDDGTGTPHNYIENRNPSDTRALREAGQWRVEVSPGTARTEDSFLQVVTVHEGDVRAIQAWPLVSTACMDGVVLHSPDGAKSACVLVQHTPGDGEASFALTGIPSFAQILAVGLSPGTRYTLTKTATSLRIKPDALGSRMASSQGVIWIP